LLLALASPFPHERHRPIVATTDFESSYLPLGLLLCYTKNMKRSIKVTPKKKRGRPATGRDPHVTSRMPRSLIDQVETWAVANETGRSEAIRRLVELGLTVKLKPTQPAGAGAERAKELAAKAIDKMTDGSASTDDQASRKRRLLKGPEEFREARVDRLKAKEK
jgi:hypothetical protein